MARDLSSLDINNTKTKKAKSEQKKAKEVAEELESYAEISNDIQSEIDANDIEIDQEIEEINIETAKENALQSMGDILNEYGADAAGLSNKEQAELVADCMQYQKQGISPDDDNNLVPKKAETYKTLSETAREDLFNTLSSSNDLKSFDEQRNVTNMEDITKIQRMCLNETAEKNDIDQLLDIKSTKGEQALSEVINNIDPSKSIGSQEKGIEEIANKFETISKNVIETANDGPGLNTMIKAAEKLTALDKQMNAPDKNTPNKDAQDMTL